MKSLSVASIATAALAVPAIAAGKPDAELIQLGEDYDKALAAWRIVHADYCEAEERLFQPALKAIPRGLPDAEFLARYGAIFTETGFGVHHDANDMALDLIEEIGAQIRAMPASSFAGLAVKMRVLRFDLEYALKLEHPIFKEDLDAEYFNGFQAEVERLARSA